MLLVASSVAERPCLDQTRSLRSSLGSSVETTGSSYGDGDLFLDVEPLIAGPAQTDGAALLGHREEGHERIGGDRRREGDAENLGLVPGGDEALDDVARDQPAIGAGAKAGLHRMQDQRLDLDQLARFGGLGRIDQDIGHVMSSMQAARVTITSAEALKNSPELVSAMATTFWESASLMRVAIWALPFSGLNRASSTCGCGFFSLKTWIALMWSASVIGLSTETVSGTALPFSTSGGMSRVTRPSRTAASPVTSLMAAAMAAGVARAAEHGSTPIATAPAKNARRELIAAPSTSPDTPRRPPPARA